jgi:hypothetical protein
MSMGKRPTGVTSTSLSTPIPNASLPEKDEAAITAEDYPTLLHVKVPAPRRLSAAEKTETYIDAIRYFKTINMGSIELATDVVGAASSFTNPHAS